MTTTELKKKIAESQNQAWFKSQTLSFNFSYINFNIELAGLSAIYEFIINQLNQWEKKSKELPKELKGSFEYFKNAKDQVSDFISRNVNKDKIILNGQWTNLQRDITNTVKVNYPFVYESPYTSFLIDINTKLPKSFSSAFNFIIGKIEYKNNDKDSYIGTLLAYEFDLKDHTKLTERRHAEKLSMNLIRNNFQNYLLKSEEELVEHLTNATKRCEEYANSINEFKTKNESFFTEWFGGSKSNFDLFDSNSKKRIQDLEKTYQEKLKLEEPAKYWAERAKQLRRQAWILTSIILFLNKFQEIKEHDTKTQKVKIIIK